MNMTMMPPTYRDDETTSRKMYLQVEPHFQARQL